MLNKDFVDHLNQLEFHDRSYRRFSQVMGISTTTISRIHSNPNGTTAKYNARAIEFLMLLPKDVRKELITNRLAMKDKPKPQPLIMIIPIMNKLGLTHKEIVKVVGWDRGSFHHAEKNRLLRPYIAYSMQVFILIEPKIRKKWLREHKIEEVNKIKLDHYLKDKRELWMPHENG